MIVQMKDIKDNARLYVNYIKQEHGIDLYNLPENSPLFMRLLAQSNLCVAGLDVDYCVDIMPLVELAARKGDPCYSERKQLARCSKVVERGGELVERCTQLLERTAIDKDALVKIVQ